MERNFTGLTTGNALSVKSSKIVAGQEPEKTNELLQCLALALDKKLSSDEAVRQFKDSGNQPADAKPKNPAKPAKKANEKQIETKKLTSRSSDKLTSSKKDTKDRSLIRNEKDKVNAAKTKQKENTVAKKENPPKKTSQQTKTITKKNSVDKQPQNEHENVISKNTNSIPNKTESEQDFTNKHENDGNDQDSGVSPDKHDVTDSVVATPPQIIPNTNQGELLKINSSFTIVEHDLNSSLSSQDLMEVDNDNVDDNITENTHGNEFGSEVKHDDYEPNRLKVFTDTIHKLQSEESTKSSRSGTSSGPQSLTKDTDKNNVPNSAAPANKIERVESSAPVTRPKSVRPSSSRPGAPRLREKYENVLAGNDNLLVGKVNIIIENTPNEEVGATLLRAITKIDATST